MHKLQSCWGKQNFPNEKIATSFRLSISIRYFACGCPLDIMSSHGVGFNDVYNSIWEIVDAINLCPQITIKFPTYHQKQQYIAKMFSKKSSVGFDNCGGCIDGVLIWTSKPTKSVLKQSGLGCKNSSVDGRNVLD